MFLGEDLPQGRELDRLIALEVFSFVGDHKWSEQKEELDHVMKECANCALVWDECCENEPPKLCSSNPKEYSTDVASAWEIVDYLRALRPGCITFNIHVSPNDGYLIDMFEHAEDTYGRFRDRGLGTVKAPTISLAICFAAIKALRAVQ